MEDKIQELADLLKETGQAHHQAFIETDGYDPDWPFWYADYLMERPSKLSKTNLTRGELADLLEHLSQIQSAEAPEESWPSFYARYLVERYT